MVGRTIAILISIGFLTLMSVAVLGRMWRFVLIRPPGPTGPRSVLQRVVVLKPGPRDFAEQEARLVRFDLPFAVVFIAGSLFLLATAGFGGAWVVTFLIWCGAAVTRWLTPSARIVPIRCAMVVLLIVDAVLVLLIRGGGALPQERRACRYAPPLWGERVAAAVRTAGAVHVIPARLARASRAATAAAGIRDALRHDALRRAPPPDGPGDADQLRPPQSAPRPRGRGRSRLPTLLREQPVNYRYRSTPPRQPGATGLLCAT
jgi:hypothetical protein